MQVDKKLCLFKFLCAFLLPTIASRRSGSRDRGYQRPVSPIAQTADEIAFFVQKAIEDDEPLFRYQTTKAIQQQAQKRFVDISGLSYIQEWDGVLFP